MKTKIKRRGLIRLVGIMGGLGASGVTFRVAGNAAAQPAASSPVQEGIEPNTIKRRGVGLRGYDAGRAFPGFTLFAPSANTNKSIYLIDLQGHVVHTWDMPYPPGYGYLTDRGTLFYNGKMPNPSFVGRAPYMCGAALEADWKGRVLWEVHHLDPVKDSITAVQDNRDGWPFANGLCELPDRNIMLSFRNISTVVMIDRRTGEIYWKLGAPPLSGQHAPTILPNGHILLFDNGPHRLDETFPFSRVLEIDPATKNIVWKYQEAPVSNFFSPRISNAQRLPNGNTLINEGWFGRFFEVPPEGAVVWEYVNPYFGGSPPTNQVFRAYRYTAEEIARAQAAT